MYTKTYAKQDKYDNDDNDMHEDLLNHRYFSLFGNIKKKLRGNSKKPQG